MLTVTPSRRSSGATHRNHVSKAAFEARYDDQFGAGVARPAVDTLTTWPLPAARIGAGATVGPASLVMRGDEVPPSTRWQGNPIAPWNLFRKKRGDAAAAPGKTDESAA